MLHGWLPGCAPHICDAFPALLVYRPWLWACSDKRVHAGEKPEHQKMQSHVNFCFKSHLPWCLHGPLAHSWFHSQISPWSEGSRLTLWQVFSNKWPSRSWTSLWRRPRYPLCAQKRPWLIEKSFPQIHWLGSRGGCQQYHRWTTSLKLSLDKENPYSAKGKAVSQLDDPFSYAVATPHRSCFGSVAHTVAARVRNLTSSHVWPQHVPAAAEFFFLLLLSHYFYYW